jgi:hypothetical protein
MATIFITMSELCVRPPVFTPRQLMRVNVASAAVATTQSRTYGRHASSLDDKQQHPPVEKCDRWMIGLAEVRVLTANFGKRGRQFSPDEGAAYSNNAAKNPGSQDQCWSVHLLRNDVGIDENTGADDAAHDEHGGVE